MSAGQLSEEIKAKLGYDTRIRITPTKVNVWFEKALTKPEEKTLKKTVADHVAKPEPHPHQEFLRDLKERWPALTAQQKLETVKKILVRLLGD